MKRVAVLAVVLAAPIARADDWAPSDPLEIHAAGDEPDGYASAGLVVGGSQGYDKRGAVLDAGRRITGDAPWFVRGIGQAGAIVRSDNPGNGTFIDVRAGLEGRDCRGGGMLCGSIGLDVGILRGEFRRRIYADDGTRIEFPERLDAFLAVPRFTIDAGGRVRFRAALELPVGMRTAAEPSATAVAALGTATPPERGAQFYLGASLTVALAIGF
jgi:hypothetical protein